MKNYIIILAALIVLIIACSCNNVKTPYTTNDSTKTNRQGIRKIISHDSVLTTDVDFIGDSLLHIDKNIANFYLKKYGPGSCPARVYAKADLRAGGNIVKVMGVIKNDTKADSVFVLYPFNTCEDGQSYYFTDTSLPRLSTDSWCCHADNLFLVGDIDEDGVQEVGWYYSSCGSHYKSLYVVSLKNNRWDTVGHSIFDQHYMSYNVPFSSYVKKTGKGGFKMLEITDMTAKDKVGKKNWIKFSM